MKKSRNLSRKTHKKRQHINYHPSPRPLNLAPPAFNMQDNRTWRLRFTCTGGTLGANIRMTDFAAAMGIVATSATTSQFISDQVRVRRICLWGPVATAGTPVVCTLKFVDDPAGIPTSGAPRTVTDTSISFDRPAYVCLQPPRDSTSVFSQWIDSNLTTAWVFIAAPAGSTMDIFFNFILDDIGQTSAGPTIAGGVAGNIYHKTFVTGAATWSVAPIQNPI